MCLPALPARPVNTEMFSAREKVRFATRETMEVYLSTRAEVFAAACGNHTCARHVAEVAAASYPEDDQGGCVVDLHAADVQLYALVCGAYPA